jgi:hypothetical protein
MSIADKSLADLLGNWVQPDWDSGVIKRCRIAWTKPLQELSREELATLLRQRVAVEHLLPLARERLRSGDDHSELFAGELEQAIEHASKDA